MKKSSIALTAICLAGMVAAAQAQNSTDSSSTGSKQSSSSGLSSGQSTDSSSSSSAISGSHKDWSKSGSLSATGRSGSQDVCATKLVGSQVKGSAGSSTLGTINDVIINPGSGRVDFAVISLGSSGATSGTLSSDQTSSTAGTSTSRSSRTSTTGTTGSLGSSRSSGEGKLVAVPWHLIRSESSSTYGSATTTGSQMSFVFNGDQSKLQGAPTFDPNTDFSQPSWRQSIYSYFGTSSGASTGGATSPGGTSSSSSTEGFNPSSPNSSSSSTSPQSSTTSPQSSSSSSTAGSSSKP